MVILLLYFARQTGEEVPDHVGVEPHVFESQMLPILQNRSPVFKSSQVCLVLSRDLNIN